MRSVGIALVLIAMVGCVGADKHDVDSTSEALCDGSDDVRFAFQIGGGFVEDTYAFTSPDGFEFLAVTGTCQYYTSSNYMTGVVTGTLTSESAAKLSRDLAWAKLDAWKDYRAHTNCADGSTVALIKSSVALSCVCQCDADAPDGLQSALDQGHTWVMNLEAAGARLDGPVRALAQPASDSGQRLTETPWPLTAAIESIPGLFHQSASPAGIVSARFDDPADAMKLRGARLERASSVDPPNSFVRMLDANKTYDVFIRDELPDAVDASLTQLLMTPAM